MDNETILAVITAVLFFPGFTYAGFWGGVVSLVIGFGLLYAIVWYFGKNNPATQKPAPIITLTPALAELLRQQSIEDRLLCLGVTSCQELHDKYPICITQEEYEEYLASVEPEASTQTYDDEAETSYQNSSWGSKSNNSNTSNNANDDTYDNFYSQREDEYKQEYGYDYEDAIDDAWDEHRR